VPTCCFLEQLRLMAVAFVLSCLSVSVERGIQCRHVSLTVQVGRYYESSGRPRLPPEDSAAWRISGTLESRIGGSFVR